MIRARSSVTSSRTASLAGRGREHARLASPRFVAVADVAAACLAAARRDAGQVPTFAELPVGSVTSPVTGRRPTSIPKGESVPGIVVTRGSNTYADVTESAPPASQDEAGMLVPGIRTCFSENPRTPSQAVDPGSGMATAAGHLQEWEGALSPRASVWRAPHESAVTELHAERVIERDGATLLESTDVWVDVSTLGARLVSRALLPLRHVGSAPGVKLFAGRDERPDGKRFVQLVVLRGSESSARHLGAIVGRRGGVILPASTCAHGRVALSSDQVGESASLELTTTLPALPPGELPLVPPPARPPAPGTTFTDLRIRPMRIHVSVSRTTRDKEPVFAVSTGWLAPELVQRIVEHMRSKHALSKPVIDPGF